MKELTVDAKRENLLQAQAFIDEELETADCPMLTQIAIDVAVEELFVNIASYAYGPKTGTATIQVMNDPGTNSVSITLSDSGIPYDPLAREDPDVTLPAEKRGIGGLGIYMVKQSMDKVDYKHIDGRNFITITKNLDS